MNSRIKSWITEGTQEIIPQNLPTESLNKCLEEDSKGKNPWRLSEGVPARIADEIPEDLP